LIWKLLKILVIIPAIKFFYKLKIQVSGRENISQDAAKVILGNQPNPITALALEAAVARKIYWAISPSVLKATLPKLLLKIFYGCFLLEPQLPDTTGFRSAFRALKKGGLLVFYPGDINRGIALFCLRSGCNILPAAITQEALNPCAINITFGPVYNLSEQQNMIVNLENIQTLMQKIKESVEKLKQ